MFQKRIIEKYLAKIDRKELDEKYRLFRSIFADERKQSNIRASKEEQYQEGFVRDLFCSVLGYTIKPEANYNILTELKNESKSGDSKKSDAAIILDGEVKAVIELKGTNTQDLDKVAFQAFSYKNHHEKCDYVIVSNFERIRIYVETQIEYEEFNLFNLSENRFALLYLFLSVEEIRSGTLLKLKHETLSEEKEITNNFYADYSIFKRCLFEDICKNNPETDKLLLFKKTQKLLDRILFILFAEDRNLLPTNSVIGINEDYRQLKKLGFPKPLYEVFKAFFERINNGFKNEEDHSRDVFAYNGGLFKSDEILDKIKVGDDVLWIHTHRLADYDFESQISVDILGRIFENSLSEIEEIEEKIRKEQNGESAQSESDSEKTLSKRKKDGVFYTPEYITKYIVENTVGKLCEEKKNELRINDEEFSNDRKYTKKQISELDEKLETYRKYLLSLKILDPACGSGAFLNAALKYLRQEHTLIDYFYSKIHKWELDFSQIDNEILENNLFGVDINEESVEITKLSLWLSTAKKNRKLSALGGNIKCGNSLISDKAAAGEKAFDWEKEFPEVFGKTEKGESKTENSVGERSRTERNGFDVVIGNPPYVNMVNIADENQRKFYQTNYKTVKNKSDLYSIFTEKASHLLKTNGLFGFIFSNSWMGTESFSAFREFLAHDVKVTKLVQLPPGVFKDATVTTVICLYSNTKPTEEDSIDIETCIEQKFVSKGFVLPYKQVLENPNTSFSFERTIELNKVKTVELGDIVSFSLGIKTSDDKRFIFSEKKDDDCHLFLRGRNINRWCLPENNEYMWYKPELMTQKPGGRPRIFENFVVEKKIVIQDMAFEINATIDCKKYLCNDKVNIIFEVDKNYAMEYILCLLNSKLVNTWFKKIYPSGLEIKVNQLRTIPIPSTENPQFSAFSSQLSVLADKMLSLNADMQKKCAKFIGRMKETYALAKTTQNIEQFYELSFADFAKELSKLKVKLTLKQKDELEDYFNEYVKDISALNEQIAACDKEINKAVYALYGLTAEEIATAEGKS